MGQRENIEEPQTCGRGLAENSILPAKLGELTGTMSENLKQHMKALDMDDRNSRLEFEAYEKLSREFDEISSLLKNVSGQMEKYRDLPMGKHDMTAMANPRVKETFEKFVKTKNELIELLEKMQVQDEQILAQMESVESIGPTS